MSPLLGSGAIMVTVVAVFLLGEELRVIVSGRPVRARSRMLRSDLLESASASAPAPAQAQARASSRALEVLGRRLGPLAIRFGIDPERRRSDRAVLLLLETTTRRLRAGDSLRLALAEAARADVGATGATRALAGALDRGVPIEESLEHWMARDAGSRRLVGMALLLASRSGGAVAGVLDGVAATLRDRLALDREIAALSSQARASAGVLIVAPVVFAMLMATIDGRVAAMLLGSPAGWACLVVGLMLDLAGALWMARLVRGVR